MLLLNVFTAQTHNKLASKLSGSYNIWIYISVEESVINGQYCAMFDRFMT